MGFGIAPHPDEAVGGWAGGRAGGSAAPGALTNFTKLKIFSGPSSAYAAFSSALSSFVALRSALRAVVLLASASAAAAGGDQCKAHAPKKRLELLRPGCMGCIALLCQKPGCHIALAQPQIRMCACPRDNTAASRVRWRYGCTERKHAGNAFPAPPTPTHAHTSVQSMS